MEFARSSGKRIVEMVWDDLKPRDILTRDAFVNATMMVLALSGSINCVKHLQAIAIEAGCDVDVYSLFDEYADKIPLLAEIRPNGERLIEELEAAGGALAVMKQLGRVIRQEARTVSGGTVGEVLREARVNDEEVIRSFERALSTRPSIVIVRGSLAPQGGIIRLGGTGERKLQFSGPANIYHSREEALEALAKNEIKKGEVVVLRGMGVKGGPGLAMSSALVFALDGAGLIEDVAVVTDGQLSGLVNRGLVVGEVSPEAAEGGPLALVQNGDRIVIDVTKRVVNLEVPEAELALRRSRAQQFGRTDETGYLAQYKRNVQPLPKGAVLLKQG